MNFYKHHLGDYAAHTSHLTWDEDCAYRRLLDQYYKREAPLPVDVKDACRLVRASSAVQRKAVEAVLREFFTLQADGWHQKRCDAEIVQASAQAETNRRIAEEREARRKARLVDEALRADVAERERSVHEASTHTNGGREPPRLQTSTSQTPPNSEANASGGEPPGAKDVVFALGVPLLTAAGVKESNARSFLAMQCRSHGDRCVADALEACSAAKAIQPIPWLTERLKPAKGNGRRHAGFSMKDYREGVTPDGSLV